MTNMTKHSLRTLLPKFNRGCIKLLLDTGLLNFASGCYALWRFALVGMVFKLARKARPIIPPEERIFPPD